MVTDDHSSEEDPVTLASRLWSVSQQLLIQAERKLASHAGKSSHAARPDELRRDVVRLRAATDILFAKMMEALARQRQGFRNGQQ
jgi:hypothetical protein